MRGIYGNDTPPNLDIRFNPAYAGNIRMSKLERQIGQVQPRVCGEYSKASEEDVVEAGSTPRMRGI